MKKIILMVAASLLSVSVYAEVEQPVSVDGLSMIKLNKISQNSMSFLVYAPGSGSGICKLSIRSNRAEDAFKKFADRFNFTEKYYGSSGEGTMMTPNASPYGLHLKLTNKGVFVADVVTISTKNKKSIGENIGALFPVEDGYSKDIALLVGMCPPNEK